VGTVWMAIALRGRPAASTLLKLKGDRAGIRSQTVAWALRALVGALAAP
jgi:nicotinamide mononucleotide (NMN) deamidase PncC